MPSSTSKIPLPKSQLVATSPNGSSPTTSKIPMKKEHSKAGSFQILNREPLQSPEAPSSPLAGPPLAAAKIAAVKASKIPDIRSTASRLSPQKELPAATKEAPLTAERTGEGRYWPPGGQEQQLPRSKSNLGDGVQRDKSAERNLQKSGGGGSSHHLATSRIPLSPTMLQNLGDSRLITPTKLQTPRYHNNNNNYGSGKPRKHSVESMPGDELEWEANLTYKDMDPEPIEIDCESQKSTTSSEHSRGDSAAPKRGRDSSVGISKMRRTSPDGESVSPTKSRRPSPSKIPISAEYLLPSHRSAGGSTEHLSRGSTEHLIRGSSEQLVRGPSMEHMLRGGSTEHLGRGSTERLHRGYTEHQLRRDSAERLLRGSTEQLLARVSTEQLRARGSTEHLVSSRSGSSSSSHQSPENFRIAARRGSLEGELLLLQGSQSCQSDLYHTAQEEVMEDEEDLELGGGEEMAPQDNYPRGGLHLDLGGKAGRTQALASQLRHQNLPEPNWSIDREDSPVYRKPPGQSQSTSRLPAPSSAQLDTPPSSRPSSHSTSRLPQLPARRPDPAEDMSSSEDRNRRRKNYEAFVMTGDRMINLAKTPANIDFQSKYYKPTEERPGRPPSADPPSAADSVPPPGHSPPPPPPPAPSISPPAPSSASPSSPASCPASNSPRPLAEGEEEEEADSQRNNQGVKGFLGKTFSQSEDQLASSEPSEEFESELGSSCTTLPSLSQSQTKSELRVLRGNSTESSSSSSSSCTSSMRGKQPSMATSPDTSSLISCSEHYNGESLLGNLSPQDLKGRRDRDSRSSSRERDTASITSRDNRVIITIGQVGQSEPNGMPSPSTSSGTLTPDYRATGEEDGRVPSFRLHDFSGGLSPPPLPPTSPLGSEEESDVESLHSYHPPIRNVDIPSASRLAKRLYNLEGFRKDDISRHLCKNNEFSRAVADEYCKLFDFDHLSLDEALRLFLSRFCLVGETQERERVLLHFSRRYLEGNPRLRGTTFQSHDAVHTLTCAIMLLNTDLHNEALQQQQRRMSPQEFVENLADLNDGHNFPRDLLLNIYSAIKKEPIEWSPNEDLSVAATDSQGADSLEDESAGPVARNGTAAGGGHEAAGLAGSVELGGQQPGGFNPFLSLPTERNACDYKRGYVIRKCCFDANKKKTKLGRRGWKMYYLTLRDLVLYCFKDEVSAQLPGAFDNPNNAIRIHHSLASIANDYRKKEFVFRLRTSDQAEFLFQTSDEQELRAWVETINTVVARFSSPQLPAPCSNVAKFQRPLYPSSRSKLTVTEQLAGHRHQTSELERQLSDHKAGLDGKKAALSPQHLEITEFLQFELHRFAVYASVLESILTKEEHQLMASPLKALAS